MKVQVLGAVVLAAGLLAAGRVGAIGAIAVDDDQKYDVPAYGYAVDFETREEAEKAAVKFCLEHGEDCRPVVWFEGCGAYAHSRRHFGYGWGSTREKASDMALEKCGKASCKVLIVACDTPTGD